MAKKMKPSLKDYLRTGKRSMPESEPAGAQTNAFLDLLAPPDLQMWESMLAAGVTVELSPLEPDVIKEDFRVMDRARFTCYALSEKGASLSPVRSDSQISGSLVLLLKWDEAGTLTVYGPNE